MSKLLTISFSFSSVPASLGSNNLNPNLILKDGPNISKDVGERDFNFKTRGNQVSNHIDFSLPILETACQPNFLSSFCWWTVIETRIDIRQFPSQVFSIYFLIISMMFVMDQTVQSGQYLFCILHILLSFFSISSKLF